MRSNEACGHTHQSNPVLASHLPVYEYMRLFLEDIYASYIVYFNLSVNKLINIISYDGLLF